MSYELLVAKGDPEAGRRTLPLHLYPNERADRDVARNDIADALETAWDQLLDVGAVEYYEINLYGGESDVDYVDGEVHGGTYFDGFTDWIDDRHGSRRGVHLGVTGHTNFANAEYVGRGETAWVANAKSFVGTAGGYDVTSEDAERYRNLAVQEVTHNVVSMEYDFVSDMTDGDEHDLGEITSSGASTPMLTFYERDDTHPTREHDRSGRGECGNGNAVWDGTHTRTLTRCTRNAVLYTALSETLGRW